LATVQNLLGLRIADRVLGPIWSSTHIEQIDVVWEETLGLEGRAAYYDHAGQLRDMIQNHLLQVLCLLAMEPPEHVREPELRDHKVALMAVVARFRPDATPAPGEGGAGPQPNELRIGLDEVGEITLRLNGAAAGSPPQLAPVVLAVLPSLGWPARCCMAVPLAG
jgi:hypothetical protein